MRCAIFILKILSTKVNELNMFYFDIDSTVVVFGILFLGILWGLHFNHSQEKLDDITTYRNLKEYAKKTKK